MGLLMILIQRAKERLLRIKIVTLDTTVSVQRHNESIKNGYDVPHKLTITNLLNYSLKQMWCWGGCCHTKERILRQSCGLNKGFGKCHALYRSEPSKGKVMMLSLNFGRH